MTYCPASFSLRQAILTVACLAVAMAGLKNRHNHILILILTDIAVLAYSVYASKSWSEAIRMIITIYPIMVIMSLY
jgi:hypothetical protein